MNMLRILGTMVYEEDHFYAACSEQGLLVWQDFMFANMDYPFDDEDFAASTELEVFQQLERLKSSPCLAVLCGNSEVEQQAAMWGASKPLWRPAFFEMHLAARCAAIAPGTLYWPSSAHGGAFPHQADTGTSSYYGVGAYLHTPQDARRSNLKFATECLAFANVPQASALERLPGGLTTRVHHPAWKQRSPRDLGAGWDFDDVRDHYLEATFNTSPQKLRYADHDRYLTLSRVTTGEVMAATFSDWRRPASACQGAMVLFLRDLWAGAGWGLVDDAGVPKACYYYLKRVLQPLAVMLSDEGVNGLFVHMCNDYPQARQLELEVTAWRGGNVQLASGKKQLRLAAHSAETLACIELFDYFMDLSYAYRFGPLPCDAVVATLKDEQGQQVTQAFYLPAGMGQRSQCDAGLTVQAIMVDEKTVRCHVHAEFLAFAVHFDVPGFQADDDY